MDPFKFLLQHKAHQTAAVVIQGGIFALDFRGYRFLISFHEIGQRFNLINPAQAKENIRIRRTDASFPSVQGFLRDIYALLMKCLNGLSDRIAGRDPGFLQLF